MFLFYVLRYLFKVWRFWFVMTYFDKDPFDVDADADVLSKSSKGCPVDGGKELKRSKARGKSIKTYRRAAKRSDGVEGVCWRLWGGYLLFVFTLSFFVCWFWLDWGVSLFG